MRRHSPAYYSPPRRGYGGRGRSPPRRGYGGYGRRNDQNSGSLLVRNIPLDCRPEELRAPFERFGVVRDVYLPKDYYSGEPRGFGFVQFVDPYDAGDAQYNMNGQIVAGRRISVVVAAENRKRPDDMRRRTTHNRGVSNGGQAGRHYNGRFRSRSRSRSFSRSRSPQYYSGPRGRSRSPRSSGSPSRTRRHCRYSESRSPGEQVHNHNTHGSYSPQGYSGDEGKWRSPAPVSRSRSRSAAAADADDESLPPRSR